ncbi:MAG: hypothetical protein JRF61_16275, partial [Deltaproteobacteria bacterium]|nr:hypothetical protein [Deltaproteobacteria bacterium]
MSFGSRRVPARLMTVALIALIPGGAGWAAEDEELEALKRRVEELERRAEANEGAEPAAEGEDSPAPASTERDGVAPGDDDPTGTDPRSFGSKFMPYYRYVELESNVEANILALFGMIRFSDGVAMTYELPVVKEIDYSQAEKFKAAAGRLPEDPFGDLPSGGIPVGNLDQDGDEIGMGDLGLRIFFKNERLRGGSVFREGGSSELLLGMETMVPTATEDVLGGKAWVISPFFATVVDMPLHGFIAAMNFFDFSPIRDNSRKNVG